jgi:hypothetical protein
MICDCKLVLEVGARGERAHVITEPFGRRRSSWTTFIASPRLIVNSFFYSHRAIWTATELMIKRCWRKQDHDLFQLMELTLYRAMGKATELINNAMKQAHDSFHFGTFLIRAMCTATQLTTLMSNTTKQTLDWLWTHTRAICTRRESSC